MAEDWFVDVRKYVADADESVVRKIVGYLGIALRNRDSSLVSFSDPKEVGRVRENYLRKKLALTDPDDTLNDGLDWVKGLMSADRTKNRVTAYYLLAHYFGKLDLFGGPAGTSAASLGGSGAVGAATLAGLTTVAADRAIASPASPAPQSSGAGSIPGQQGSSSRPADSTGSGDDDKRGSGWPTSLTWLLIALAVIALFFILRSCMAEKPSGTTNLASNAPAAPAAMGEANIGVNANAVTANADAGAAAAAPTGAGVITGTRDNKPVLTVYFDTGKSSVTKDMAAAAATLKTYLGANPGSKLAVSGYNDPSGNAALNAGLSKKRAQAVAAALKSAGIAEGAVELVKPADTTTATVTPEQARRVEVTVQQ